MRAPRRGHIEHTHEALAITPASRTRNDLHTTASEQVEIEQTQHATTHSVHVVHVGGTVAPKTNRKHSEKLTKILSVKLTNRQS